MFRNTQKVRDRQERDQIRSEKSVGGGGLIFARVRQVN